MVQVLFIAGTSYCGSTLTSLVLNSHPAMTSVGELTGPLDTVRPDYPCSCGIPLWDCDFWKNVSAEATGRGVAFGPGNWKLRFEEGQSGVRRRLITQALGWRPLDELRHRLLGGDARVRAGLGEAGKRNRVVIQSILAHTGARVFVDASKDPVRARLMDAVPGLEVRVLHLVRDPRGFVASNGSYLGHGLVRSALMWNRSFASVESLRAALPTERFLRVRYEDLCQDVARELRRVSDFAGVEPFRLPVRFREGQHVIGNRMRKGGSDEIKLDERWRERLTPGQAGRILQLTAHHARTVGYP